MSENKTTKTVVRSPFKVTHAGVGYWPGQLAEVPPHVAAEWAKLGFVDLVDPPAKTEPKRAETDKPESEQPEPEPQASESKPSRRRR